VNEIDPPKWVKSTRCASGTCVEVAKVDDAYLIRDSKRPEVAPLSFTAEEWTAFVDGVTAGEFRF
jgi:hypothetical protein